MAFMLAEIEDQINVRVSAAAGNWKLKQELTRPRKASLSWTVALSFAFASGTTTSSSTEMISWIRIKRERPEVETQVRG